MEFLCISSCPLPLILLVDTAEQSLIHLHGVGLDDPSGSLPTQEILCLQLGISGRNHAETHFGRNPNEFLHFSFVWKFCVCCSDSSCQDGNLWRITHFFIYHFSKIFPPCSTNFSADTFLALFPQFLISVSYFLKLSNWALFQDPCDFMLDKYLPCFISFSPTMAIPFRNLTLLILFDLCLILQCDYL